MTLDPRPGLPKQFARGRQVAASAYPIRKPSQCLLEFLPRSFPLHLEGTMSGFATEKRHPQKLEVLGFFSPLIGMSIMYPEIWTAN
jgi:hypothetical protein